VDLLELTEALEPEAGLHLFDDLAVLLLEQLSLDLIVDLFERDRIPPLEGLQDVEAEAGLDGADRLVQRGVEGRSRDLLDELVALEPAQVPALSTGSSIDRELLGELGEVLASAELLHDLLGESLLLNQDVARAGLGLPILDRPLVVGRLDRRVRDALPDPLGEHLLGEGFALLHAERLDDLRILVETGFEGLPVEQLAQRDLLDHLHIAPALLLVFDLGIGGEAGDGRDHIRGHIEFSVDGEELFAAGLEGPGDPYLVTTVVACAHHQRRENQEPQVDLRLRSARSIAAIHSARPRHRFETICGRRTHHGGVPVILPTIAAALASTPAAEVTWKGDQAQIHLSPPSGYDISPDAPADLLLRWEGRELAVSGFGAELLGGISVGDLRGTELEGEVALQLCSKADGVCTPGEFALSGTVPEAKKGSLALSVGATKAAEPAHGSSFNSDASDAAESAFSAAEQSKELVILDFSAVWCPPCNLLAAEVLHAPDSAELLDGFQLAVLDVDHPSSWTLKDRYDVGGYPTVVVVDPEGKELDRVVGYPGREDFLSFLANVTSEKTDYSKIDPSTLEPDEAARGLWLQVQNEVDEGLEPWLEASKSSDLVDAHLARFHIDPNTEDAAWLAENAPESTLEWVPWAGDWGDTDGAAAPMRAAIQGALTVADGAEAADLLYYAAQLAEESDQPTLYGAAYATLKASLTGDPLLDRANWTFLASLQAKAGDLDGAVAFLDQLTEDNPQDPTFLLSAANLLNRSERYEASLERSTTAMERSWGDNQLRVALAQCEALEGLGRHEDAKKAAKSLLDQAGDPDEGLQVRTHRYREKLAKYLD